METWPLVKWNRDAKGGLEARMPEDVGKRLYAWSGHGPVAGVVAVT